MKFEWNLKGYTENFNLEDSELTQLNIVFLVSVPKDYALKNIC